MSGLRENVTSINSKFQFDDHQISKLEAYAEMIGVFISDVLEEEITGRMNTHFLDTPERAVLAQLEMLSGYGQNVADIFTVFEEDGIDEMIILRDIPFVSMCEHHMLPFLGKAHIAYLPQDGIIVGISKLVRLLHIFAKRLQTQERLARQIVDALDDYLKPLGSACVIEAQHLCMIARGVTTHDAVLTTSALTGAFGKDGSPTTRAEFLSLINRKEGAL